MEILHNIFISVLCVFATLMALGSIYYHFKTEDKLKALNYDVSALFAIVTYLLFR